MPPTYGEAEPQEVLASCGPVRAFPSVAQGAGPTCSCSSPAPPAALGDRQHHGRRVVTCAAGELWSLPQAPRLHGVPGPTLAE